MLVSKFRKPDFNRTCVYSAQINDGFVGQLSKNFPTANARRSSDQYHIINKQYTVEESCVCYSTYPNVTEEIKFL